MSTVVRDLIRTTLVRSAYVASAFAAALLLLHLSGQTPERSVWEWILVASLLGLLAFLAGLLATFFELRER